ncbi:insulinase family protein [Thalassotalea sp. M1531]|uniref:Insulinase family protein n=1 Tax=Thalassotalea algicola TaxID=2716224 RepID=A0A7Y0Q6T8_9GAMM|nr:pitrilysin family protein [Thalassotalea algicola]NMP30320.1 insulinase family protein [Thalassotalea algicola]
MKLVKSLLLSLAVISASQTIAKEQPPIGKQPGNFTVPETHHMSLPNGMKVTFIPYGATPKATVRLITNTGNVDDGNKIWLSDLSFEMLRQGTEAQSAKELAEAVASMGGQIQTSVGMDASWLGMDVLSEFSGDAVDVIADMVLNSRMAEQDLERIKTDRQRQLKVSMSRPGPIANEAFYKEIFGNHPYGQLYPSESSLAGIESKDVEQFIQTNLVPNRSHLYISGVFDQKKVSAAIEQAFAQWKMGEARKQHTVLTQSGPKVKLIDRPDAPQSTIRLGLATFGPEHEDYLEMAMMNTLLGGAFSSRITSNIREDKGYTYSPRSRVVNRVGTGLWYQGADVTAESTGASLYEIFEEIRLLAKEPPGKEELDGIKNYMSGIFVLSNSSRSAIINQLSFLALHGLSDQYLKQYVAKVFDATPEQISAMVTKYLTAEKMTLVVVGDIATVEPQLKALEALKQYW